VEKVPGAAAGLVVGFKQKRPVAVVLK